MEAQFWKTIIYTRHLQPRNLLKSKWTAAVTEEALASKVVLELTTHTPRVTIV